MRDRIHNRRREMPQRRRIRKSDKSSADNRKEGRSVPDVIITLLIAAAYADAPLARHAADAYNIIHIICGLRDGGISLSNMEVSIYDNL